jgi:RND family efflux transporter MFP subunit
VRARLGNLEEQVRVAQESVTVARVQVDNTEIRAPFSGVVVAKSAQPGEMISPISAGGGFTRTGIGTIVDMDSLEIEVDVNEAYINRVQPGQPVESVLNAYPDWKIPSHVIAIIPTADRSKATVKVRIAVDLKDPRIVPDMGVRVSFLEEKKPEAPATAQVPRGALVPTSAIRTRDGHDVVYLMREKRAERRTVTLGTTRGDSREVLSGVSIGDAVILDPPDDLKDGAAVTVAK